MTAGYFTAHAEKRLQQRAIPNLVIELLERFGTVIRSGSSDKLIFDKAAKKRMRLHLGGERGMRVVERWLGAYMVVSDDGQVITVGHRSCRSKRQ